MFVNYCVNVDKDEGFVVQKCGGTFTYNSLFLVFRSIYSCRLRYNSSIFERMFFKNGTATLGFTNLVQHAT